jgi:ribosome-associated heat shock protein Hsp15
MTAMHEPGTDPVRVDRWLWAARLVKTRALAVEAIKGGRVAVNGERAKPSKDVRPGDELEFSSGPFRRVVLIRATGVRRGPASAAALLYEETPESVAARERLLAQRRADGATGLRGGPRPTKRDRRRLDAERRGRR